MPKIRLATFNVENLLMRCDFSKAGIADPRRRLTDVSDQKTAEAVSDAFNVLSEDDRTLTAQALAATRADVCAVQEVENLVTLARFNQSYLSRWCPSPYPHIALKEGNDSRGIDVGLLSRLPIVRQESHAHLRFSDLGLRPPSGQSAASRVFRRDCLETDIVRDGKLLTLYIVHFKSMHGGREDTRAVRDAEARGVRALIERRFSDPAQGDWVILGDFNDYFEIDGSPVTDHGLGALLKNGFAIDMAAMTVSEPEQRWSHHYSPLKQYSALDHILVSPKLADINKDTGMSFIRIGVPWRSKRHTGFRLPGVGWATPKASDHCPLVVDLTYEGTDFDDNNGSVGHGAI